jgi:hypothetical protein
MAITDEEGSRAGATSMLIWGIVSACMLILLLIVGLGGKSVAPNTPQPNAESPATSGAQKP